jgi:hypothetical protein
VADMVLANAVPEYSEIEDACPSSGFWYQKRLHKERVWLI